MQQPYRDNGQLLDASYSIDPVEGGFDLVIESRGGSQRGGSKGRNSDYAPAIELLLTRMQGMGMTLVAVQVASSIAQSLSVDDRKVALAGFKLPLSLSDVDDLTALRHAIGRASAAFGRSDGADRGNRTKRMRLSIGWDNARRLAATEISGLLAHPSKESPDLQPTSDPVELAIRVQSAIREIQARNRAPVAPAGQSKVARTSVLVTRFERDPKVIAWVLNEAQGCCEACGKPAPFLNDEGVPFLEVHHVSPLSEGGPDIVENAVACCPNCHRKLHFGRGREQFRLATIEATHRLRDHSRP